jgi:pimeloyl-ACP methyl ester carboxylesterase
MTKPPVLLLHGVFGSPSLLRPWVRFLEESGYVCHVPCFPGREPPDDRALEKMGVAECVHIALRAYDEIGEPAIVIGHSFGGFIAQKVAAARNCAGMAMLAPVPPGVLWPQLRSLPHLFPVLPAILAGRPFRPSANTMRAVPLSTLPPEEQEALIPRLVRDSGRVFRTMSLGPPIMRVDADNVTCPVLCATAGADRNVAPWISRRIAARYRAEHHVYPGLPHWIIAESALPQVGPPTVAWLDRVIRR